MKFWRWTAFTLFALLIVTPVLADAQDKPQAPAVIQAHPALWIVHSRKATAYLLGSVHLLPANVSWRTPEIEAAMNESDVFVFEAPTDEKGQAQFQAFIVAHGTLPRGTTLPSLLSSEASKDYTAALDITGVPPDYLMDKRPWYAALILRVAAIMHQRYSPEIGVDLQVFAKAKLTGKSFRYFETVDQQLSLFAQRDRKLEIDEFDAGLKQLLKEQANPALLVGAWARGDVAAIDKEMNSELSTVPGARKILLDDRNRNWVAKLRGMLGERHTYFVTVGAGHLAGSGSVPALLRTAGYRVDGP